MSFEKLDFELPASLLIGGRRYFRQSEIDALKTKLMARGMNRAEPNIAEVDPKDDKLIAAPKVMRDLGLARRSFYRKMKEADDKAAAATKTKRIKKPTSPKLKNATA